MSSAGLYSIIHKLSSRWSMYYTYKWVSGYTVEPPNKGHVGDNINLLVLSFVENSSQRL